MSDSWPYRGTVFTRGQPLPDKDDPDIESRVTPNLHHGAFETYTKRMIWVKNSRSELTDT
jgi:hypothetical protein